MNGTLAAIFFASSLLDPEVSLATSISQMESSPYRAAGLGQLEFQRKHIGSELNWISGGEISYGPLQRVTSFSLTDESGFWLGTGFTNPIKINDLFSFRFSFLPGVYIKGNEVDLGGWLMFRSVTAVELSLADDFVLSLAYDHRSSGDVWSYNPGLETWQFQLVRYLN